MFFKQVKTTVDYILSIILSSHLRHPIENPVIIYIFSYFALKNVHLLEVHSPGELCCLVTALNIDIPIISGGVSGASPASLATSVSQGYPGSPLTPQGPQVQQQGSPAPPATQPLPASQSIPPVPSVGKPATPVPVSGELTWKYHRTHKKGMNQACGTLQKGIKMAKFMPTNPTHTSQRSIWATPLHHTPIENPYGAQKNAVCPNLAHEISLCIIFPCLGLAVFLL